MREVALRLLAVRSRSCAELRAQLRRRGFEPSAIKDELARLEELGLVDDVRLALAWARYRLESRPMGRFALRRDLLGRGLEGEVVERALEAAYAERPEAEWARRAAQKKLASLRGERRFERLGAFLKRRGFADGLALEVCRELLGTEELPREE
ncbi:MAG: regulatory protein RecX [Nitrospinota bacterium]